MELSDDVHDTHTFIHLTLEVPGAVKGFALPSGRGFSAANGPISGARLPMRGQAAQQNKHSVPISGRSLQRQISRMRCSTELPQATLIQLQTINIKNRRASGAKVPLGRYFSS